MCVGRVRPDVVYSHKVIVVTLQTTSAFAVIQSEVHLLWARFFGSTAMDLPCYRPSDCFETFPFPQDWERNSELRSFWPGVL